MQGDKPVIKVEDQPVEIDDLAKKLKAMAKTSNKANVWLDIDDKVPYGTMISIYDQAGEADVTVMLQVPGPPSGKKK